MTPPVRTHLSFSLDRTTMVGRRGTIRFGELEIQTPIFMPVGTVGSVKALSSEEVWNIGYRLILGNTYHLLLRPGMSVMGQAGGLHRFMNWPGAILTDSGGFQVMSLAKIRKMTEEGVTFASHIDGSKIFLSPENVCEIQGTIDSDIQMVLDECTPYPATVEVARASMERSMRWAKRAREAHHGRRAQFGIVQGGMHAALRQESAQRLQEIGFDGYAIGGLSVGEPKDEMRAVLAATTPHLTEKLPRYLMGVGAPDDLFDAVTMGIDMFDCVMPTRNARNGTLFVRTSVSPDGKMHIKNAKHKEAFEPIDPKCRCAACRNYTKSYLRHLFVAEELLVYRLLTLHNLQFLYDLMEEIRTALDSGQSEQAMTLVRKEYVGTK